MKPSVSIFMCHPSGRSHFNAGLADTLRQVERLLPPAQRMKATPSNKRYSLCPRSSGILRKTETRKRHTDAYGRRFASPGYRSPCGCASPLSTTQPSSSPPRCIYCVITAVAIKFHYFFEVRYFVGFLHILSVISILSLTPPSLSQRSSNAPPKTTTTLSMIRL